MQKAADKQKYADVIVDITHEKLDRVYQYRIPDALADVIVPGTCVDVPFGRSNHLTRAYVLALSDAVDYDPAKIKEIAAVSDKGLTIESRLIRLAMWIRHRYGCTMIQALRTVLPVKEKETGRRQKQLRLAVSREEAQQLYQEAVKKKHQAKARLLQSLAENPVMLQTDAVKNLQVGSATIAALVRDGVLTVSEVDAGGTTGPADGSAASEEPVCGTSGPGRDGTAPQLSGEQSRAVEQILNSWQETPDKPCLIEGVTGSGKTLVYMALAEKVLQAGRQVIILIPEISLSWQNVKRFRQRFGDIVTVIHSRMSRRERYQHYEKVQSGSAQIVVGPRSALFTPFTNTGLIILDEEQESSYRSEETPRYDARETAIARARIEGAHVVFGSATPSLDSACRARSGEWLYVRLTERYGNAVLPEVEIVDMRKELQAGNRSMISRTLQEQIADRLAKGQQTILFLNKRGMAGFVSCRSCGAVIKCPHCDVSLTAHRNGMLICHYCNYRTPYLTACPVCGSPHIYGFRAGTEKIEQTVKTMFPEARVIRMDADTTGGRDGHDRILKAFAAHEADILIGTQMIVKGHDFPDVTLVGALLADLSLFASDYRAAERTYQLIVQAVGRAGRGTSPGSAVIQTYNPDHYSIESAAGQDYDYFYRQELGVRELLRYPPAAHLLTIHLSCRDAARLATGAGYVKQYLARVQKNRAVTIIGPAPEAVAKVQEYHRAVISIQGEKLEDLLQMRAFLESYIEINSGFDEIRVQYDLDR
ncbi:MAG: primosomal protein N' [Eubacterium sp.]|nr:primosomal protein N' [Eubacterium sp.]